MSYSPTLQRIQIEETFAPGFIKFNADIKRLSDEIEAIASPAAKIAERIAYALKVHSSKYFVFDNHQTYSPHNQQSVIDRHEAIGEKYHCTVKPYSEALVNFTHYFFKPGVTIETITADVKKEVTAEQKAVKEAKQAQLDKLHKDKAEYVEKYNAQIASIPSMQELIK